MSKKAKTSLKLPIFLIIGPALGLILSIFIYAIVNFIFSGVTAEPASSSEMSLSDGASIAQGLDSNGDSSMVRTISNALLFLLGSVSVLAFVPCLVFGIVILSRRRNPQTDDGPVTKNKESRDWGDLE